MERLYRGSQRTKVRGVSIRGRDYRAAYCTSPAIGGLTSKGVSHGLVPVTAVGAYLYDGPYERPSTSTNFNGSGGVIRNSRNLNYHEIFFDREPNS
jgi:hypothetical protein